MENEKENKNKKETKKEERKRERVREKERERTKIERNWKEKRNGWNESRMDKTIVVYEQPQRSTTIPGKSPYMMLNSLSK